jgi:hypothetical protein
MNLFLGACIYIFIGILFAIFMPYDGPDEDLEMMVRIAYWPLFIVCGVLFCVMMVISMIGGGRE